MIVQTEVSTEYLNEQCERVDYAGTIAYHDGQNYYNDFGEILRNPSQYDTSSDGYTPFGDESY